MKTYIFLLLFALATYDSFAQFKKDVFHTKVGDTVPAFAFEIEPGAQVNITDYEDKLVLINFFATWCVPCNAELIQVQKRIWEKYKDNPEFRFFVFGREEGWDLLMPFKRKRGFTFPMLPDKDGSIFKKFAIEGIPKNVIIDGGGKIIFQSSGYEDKGFEKMVQFIEERLKNTQERKH